jgi:hypothetical protein
LGVWLAVGQVHALIQYTRSYRCILTRPGSATGAASPVASGMQGVFELIQLPCSQYIAFTSVLLERPRRRNAALLIARTLRHPRRSGTCMSPAFVPASPVADVGLPGDVLRPVRDIEEGRPSHHHRESHVRPSRNRSSTHAANPDSTSRRLLRPHLLNLAAYTPHQALRVRKRKACSACAVHRYGSAPSRGTCF